MEKRKAGQPEKIDKKINETFRIHPDIVAYLRSKKNKVEFIEKLICSQKDYKGGFIR